MSLLNITPNIQVEGDASGTILIYFPIFLVPFSASAINFHYKVKHLKCPIKQVSMCEWFGFLKNILQFN